MIPLYLNRTESLQFSMADGKERQEGVVGGECFQTSFPGRGVATALQGSAVVTLTVGREWKTASWVQGQRWKELTGLNRALCFLIQHKRQRDMKGRVITNDWPGQVQQVEGAFGLCQSTNLSRRFTQRECVQISVLERHGGRGLEAKY